MKRLGRAVLAALMALVMAPSAAQQAVSPASPLTPQPARAVPPELPQPQGVHPLTKADADAWLDGYMPYALRSGDIAGAVVTIVANGQMVTARGYGYSDVAKRRPVDPDRTLFRPGSVSNRTNEVMKALTIVTVLFLPLNFLVGFFGMNFFGDNIHLSEMRFPHTLVFWALCLTMIAAPVTMWLWAKWRGWF